MRIRWAPVAAAVVAALTLSACTEEPDPNVLDVTPADFVPYSTAARLAGEARITVGVSGIAVDADGVPTGFEPELAAVIAGALGIERHEITWIAVEPGHHERLVEDRQVDILLAAMAVTDERLEIMDAAGPYYTGNAATLTRGVAGDLSDQAVCVDTDSGLDPYVGTTELTARAPLSECITRLLAGEVDAAVGPDLLVADHATEFTVTAIDGTVLSYGVGLVKGDDEFREFVNDVLEAAAADGRWAQTWDTTAGEVLGPATPPLVDRY